MTAAKPIAATCVAIALVVPSYALASPAGSEYLPQVPKSSKDDSDRSSSGSGDSSGTDSSSVVPTVTESTSSSGDSGDSGESPAKKQRPTKEREKDKPKVSAAPVKVAPVSADTAGSSDLLPVALLLGLGAVILSAGAVLRRQHAKRLRDPAG
jgi:hypothetical protein